MVSDKDIILGIIAGTRNKKGKPACAGRMASKILLDSKRCSTLANNEIGEENGKKYNKTGSEMAKYFFVKVDPSHWIRLRKRKK